MDIESQRQAMIALIEERGVTDPRVLNAMRRVPREEFVANAFRDRAYDDCALPATEGQTISQPYMVAAMTELLAPGPSDRILEIGTGTGYQCAVLSLLAREVVTIERLPGPGGVGRGAADADGVHERRVSRRRRHPRLAGTGAI